MDSAVGAFRAWGVGFALIGDVRLWVGGEIDYRVGYGIGTAERDNNSFSTVGECNIPARVGQEDSSVPGLV